MSNFQDYLKDILDEEVDGWLDQDIGVITDDAWNEVGGDGNVDTSDAMTWWRWDVLGSGDGSDVYWQDTSEFLEDSSNWMDSLDSETLAALQVAFTTLDDDFKSEYNFGQDEDGYNNFMMFLYVEYQNVAFDGLIKDSSGNNLSLNNGGDWYDKDDSIDWEAIDNLTEADKEFLDVDSIEDYTNLLDSDDIEDINRLKYVEENDITGDAVQNFDDLNDTQQMLVAGSQGYGTNMSVVEQHYDELADAYNNASEEDKLDWAGSSADEAGFDAAVEYDLDDYPEWYQNFIEQRLQDYGYDESDATDAGVFYDDYLGQWLYDLTEEEYNAIFEMDYSDVMSANNFTNNNDFLFSIMGIDDADLLQGIKDDTSGMYEVWRYWRSQMGLNSAYHSAENFEELLQNLIDAHEDGTEMIDFFESQGLYIGDDGFYPSFDLMNQYLTDFGYGEYEGGEITQELYDQLLEDGYVDDFFNWQYNDGEEGFYQPYSWDFIYNVEYQPGSGENLIDYLEHNLPSWDAGIYGDDLISALGDELRDKLETEGYDISNIDIAEGMRLRDTINTYASGIYGQFTAYTNFFSETGLEVGFVNIANGFVDWLNSGGEIDYENMDSIDWENFSTFLQDTYDFSVNTVGGDYWTDWDDLSQEQRDYYMGEFDDLGWTEEEFEKWWNSDAEQEDRADEMAGYLSIDDVVEYLSSESGLIDSQATRWDEEGLGTLMEVIGLDPSSVNDWINFKGLIDDYAEDNATTALATQDTGWEYQTGYSTEDFMESQGYLWDGNYPMDDWYYDPSKTDADYFTNMSFEDYIEYLQSLVDQGYIEQDEYDSYLSNYSLDFINTTDDLGNLFDYLGVEYTDEQLSYIIDHFGIDNLNSEDIMGLSEDGLTEYLSQTTPSTSEALRQYLTLIGVDESEFTDTDIDFLNAVGLENLDFDAVLTGDVDISDFLLEAISNNQDESSNWYSEDELREHYPQEFLDVWDSMGNNAKDFLSYNLAGGDDTYRDGTVAEAFSSWDGDPASFFEAYEAYLNSPVEYDDDGNVIDNVYSAWNFIVWAQNSDNTWSAGVNWEYAYTEGDAGDEFWSFTDAYGEYYDESDYEEYPNYIATMDYIQETYPALYETLIQHGDFTRWTSGTSPNYAIYQLLEGNIDLDDLGSQSEISALNTVYGDYGVEYLGDIEEAEAQGEQWSHYEWDDLTDAQQEHFEETLEEGVDGETAWSEAVQDVDGITETMDSTPATWEEEITDIPADEEVEPTGDTVGDTMGAGGYKDYYSQTDIEDQRTLRESIKVETNRIATMDLSLQSVAKVQNEPIVRINPLTELQPPNLSVGEWDAIVGSWITDNQQGQTPLNYYKSADPTNFAHWLELRYAKLVGLSYYKWLYKTSNEQQSDQSGKLLVDDNIRNNITAPENYKVRRNLRNFEYSVVDYHIADLPFLVFASFIALNMMKYTKFMSNGKYPSIVKYFSELYSSIEKQLPSTQSETVLRDKTTKMIFEFLYNNDEERKPAIAFVGILLIICFYRYYSYVDLEVFAKQSRWIYPNIIASYLSAVPNIDKYLSKGEIEDVFHFLLDSAKAHPIPKNNDRNDTQSAYNSMDSTTDIQKWVDNTIRRLIRKYMPAEYPLYRLLGKDDQGLRTLMGIFKDLQPDEIFGETENIVNFLVNTYDTESTKHGIDSFNSVLRALLGGNFAVNEIEWFDIFSENYLSAGVRNLPYDILNVSELGLRVMSQMDINIISETVAIKGFIIRPDMIRALEDQPETDEYLPKEPEVIPTTSDILTTLGVDIPTTTENPEEQLQNIISSAQEKLTGLTEEKDGFWTKAVKTGLGEITGEVLRKYGVPHILTTHLLNTGGEFIDMLVAPKDTPYLRGAKPVEIEEVKEDLKDWEQIEPEEEPIRPANIPEEEWYKQRHKEGEMLRGLEQPIKKKPSKRAELNERIRQELDPKGQTDYRFTDLAQKTYDAYTYKYSGELTEDDFKVRRQPRTKEEMETFIRGGNKDLEISYDEDDMDYIMTFDKNTGELNVSWRGSRDLSDWVDNLSGIPLKTFLAGNNEVHTGFEKVYNKYKEKINKFINTYNVKKINIGGHSRGGAVSNFMLEDIADKYKEIPINVRVYGTPATFGGSRLDNFNRIIDNDNVKYKRINLEGDPVPLIIQLFSQLQQSNNGYNIEVDEEWDKTSIRDIWLRKLNRFKGLTKGDDTVADNVKAFMMTTLGSQHSLTNYKNLLGQAVGLPKQTVASRGLSPLEIGALLLAVWGVSWGIGKTREVAQGQQTLANVIEDQFTRVQIPEAPQGMELDRERTFDAYRESILARAQGDVLNPARVRAAQSDYQRWIQQATDVGQRLQQRQETERGTLGGRSILDPILRSYRGIPIQLTLQQIRENMIFYMRPENAGLDPPHPQMWEIPL